MCILDQNCHNIDVCKYVEISSRSPSGDYNSFLTWCSFEAWSAWRSLDWARGWGHHREGRPPLIFHKQHFPWKSQYEHKIVFTNSKTLITAISPGSSNARLRPRVLAQSPSGQVASRRRARRLQSSLWGGHIRTKVLRNITG